MRKITTQSIHQPSNTTNSITNPETLFLEKHTGETQRVLAQKSGTGRKRAVDQPPRSSDSQAWCRTGSCGARFCVLETKYLTLANEVNSKTTCPCNPTRASPGWAKIGRPQITAITGAAAKDALAEGKMLQARAAEISTLKGAELEGAVATFRCWTLLCVVSGTCRRGFPRLYEPS